MMRLDRYLVEYGYFTTRAKAQDAIQAGNVSVDHRIITKNSYEVKEDSEIIVKEAALTFVSRAGFKLYDVLQPFDIHLEGRNVIDVGASTGGFSDVCLKEGANFVYALDVGSDQLAPELLKETRLCNMENINCRYITKDIFDHPINFACVDVSFISLQLILPAVVSCMDVRELVVLVKPQFEAGKAAIGKHGIVKNKKVHERVLADMVSFVTSLNLYVHHIAKSSVIGRDGNQEYVMHIKEEPCNTIFDYKQLTTKR